MTSPSFRAARRALRLAAAPSAALLAGCATLGGALDPTDPGPIEIAARLEEAPTTEVIALPEPLPLPGQLKPIELPEPTAEPTDPRRRVGDANAAARIEPVRDGFINAIQLYPYTDGALYQVYAAPGQVTDIALEEGERLVGPGPIAAGDTARWIIGDTLSGTGASERVHILVKPTGPSLVTNLVINTDRRTYHLELRSTPATYMASVSWTYPHDALIALRARRTAEAAAAPVAAGLDLETLDFGYRIEGDRPSWRPLRAFDDGRQVFIEFPAGIAQDEMPPLFLTDPADGVALVNYRVAGRHMIVDRLFASAELRLGGRRGADRVRIVREDGRSDGARAARPRPRGRP